MQFIHVIRRKRTWILVKKQPVSSTICSTYVIMSGTLFINNHWKKNTFIVWSHTESRRYKMLIHFELSFSIFRIYLRGILETSSSLSLFPQSFFSLSCCHFGTLYTSVLHQHFNSTLKKHIYVIFLESSPDPRERKWGEFLE